MEKKLIEKWESAGKSHRSDLRSLLKQEERGLFNLTKKLRKGVIRRLITGELFNREGEGETGSSGWTTNVEKSTQEGSRSASRGITQQGGNGILHRGELWDGGCIYFMFYLLLAGRPETTGDSP